MFNYFGVFFLFIFTLQILLIHKNVCLNAQIYTISNGQLILLATNISKSFILLINHHLVNVMEFYRKPLNKEKSSRKLNVNS